MSEKKMWELRIDDVLRDLIPPLQEEEMAISFNVKTKESAYGKYVNYYYNDENAPDGYNGNKGDGTHGDPETDYPGAFIENPEIRNDTSSDWPGFYSNTKATLTYTQKHTGHPDRHGSAVYDKPVVQVSTRKLKVRKVWADSDTVDHSGDSVVVRLYMKLPSNTKFERTDRAITLNEANNWSGEFEVVSNYGDYANAEYRFQEEPYPNYTPVVTLATEFGEPTGAWTSVTLPTTTNGTVQAHLLYTDSSGTTYALNNSNSQLSLTAPNKDSNQQKWTITKVSGGYTFRNVGNNNLYMVRTGNNNNNRKIQLSNQSNAPRTLAFEGGKIYYTYTHNNSSRYCYLTLDNNGNLTSGRDSSLNNAIVFSAQQYMEGEPTLVEKEDSYIITNTPKTVDVGVIKVWSDGESAHSGESVTVTLYKNGAATDKTLTLDAGNNWQGSFMGLDKEYYDAEEGVIADCVYTVVETPVVHYDVSYSEPVQGASGEITVTNTKRNVIVLKKVSDSDAPLSGAVFDLYQQAEGEARVYIFQNKESGEDGVFSPANLELNVGTYYLEETLAPAGYNGLTAPAVITVQQDGRVSVNVKGNTHTYETTDGVFTIPIVNTSGYQLPETGGNGTAIHYTLGVLLMACALMYGCKLRRKQERRYE